MKLFTKSLLVFTLLTATQAYAGNYIDWRKIGSDQEKQNNLVKALPGTSTHMLQVGERYRHLYWAGKLGKWQFAEYQLEEIQDLLNTVGITRPKRKATADIFLDKAFTLFPSALKNKNQQQFFKAFKNMRSECLSCHAANDHSFITLPSAPKRSDSLVLE